MRDATSAAPRIPFRRRRILIRPAYQLRVAVLILLGILFYSGLLGFLLFYPLMAEFEAAGGEQQFRLAELVLSLHMRFWPAVLVVAVLVAAHSLFVTHRVVGPAYHLGRVMRELGEGKLSARARLRRFDQLKELETVLNALGENLEREAHGRVDRMARLRAAAGILAAELRGAEALPPGARQAMAELERLTAPPTGTA